MRISICLLLIVFFVACSNNYLPKPKAFLKVSLPDKKYERNDFDDNFSFEKPIYAIFKSLNQDFFYDLDFPNQNSVLHITYVPVKANLLEHIEKSRSLAYKHNMMADAISETVYINEEFKVYGLLYDFEGVTATSAQFYLTDSIKHFFRGALYFNTEITDSLLPVNNFIKEDIKHIIETFRWEN